jgi:hypothetical protein
MCLSAAVRLVFAIFLLATAPGALAVRPFITDDARVVGGRQAQMETWARGDRRAFEQWALASYGPTDALELMIGSVHGLTFEHGREYSVAGPVLQAKYLLRAPKTASWPGVAVSAEGLCGCTGGTRSRTPRSRSRSWNTMRF